MRRTEETPFEIVCRLAEANDEAGLTAAAEAGVFLYTQQGEYNTVSWLAKQGKYIAVELLINKFGANRDWAVYGYARAGNIAKVEELIEQGARLNEAVLGYVLSGYWDEAKELIRRGANKDYIVFGLARVGDVAGVNRLIAQGASRILAARGYARVDNVDQINELIRQGASPNHVVYTYARFGNVSAVNQLIAQGASRDQAVEGYARVGNVDQVNEQIRQGASREMAKRGYEEGGFCIELSILHLMALTDDVELRKLLAQEIKEKDAVFFMFKKATKLNLLIRNYALTYNEARHYLMLAANGWLFQGQQHVKNEKIPMEIYLLITSFITGCSPKEARFIFDVANKRLHEQVVKDVATGFLTFFKPQETIARKQKMAEERYRQRAKITN